MDDGPTCVCGHPQIVHNDPTDLAAWSGSACSPDEVYGPDDEGGMETFWEPCACKGFQAATDAKGTTDEN